MSGPPVVEYDDFGRELLPPIVYEPAEGGGWAVPASEQATWARLIAQREQRGGVYASGRSAASPAQNPKPIQSLVVELENWLSLDDYLEAELRRTYEDNPLRVTRIAASVIAGCEAKRLSSPGGLLRSLLRKV